MFENVLEGFWPIRIEDLAEVGIFIRVCEGVGFFRGWWLEFFDWWGSDGFEVMAFMNY